MTALEFMKAMRLQFGHFEFCATSPAGTVVKSNGWKECPYKIEVIPQIPLKAKK